MEHRRDSELTDEELAMAEAETRALLARWGEPSLVPPPADLSARVVRQLSSPPARWHWSWHLTWWLVPLVLLAFGVWGLGFDSSGPAALFGDPATGLGRYVLMLILMAKPLWHLWLAGVWWWGVDLAVLIIIGWIWWRCINDAPLAKVG